MRKEVASERVGGKRGMGERAKKRERERGKLGLDEKMLRPVALHTRGHQIKSLVVSAAHPSVRSRANEKIKKSRGGRESARKKKRPARGGGAFMVYLGARGTFYRKRHRFFAILAAHESRTRRVR